MPCLKGTQIVPKDGKRKKKAARYSCNALAGFSCLFSSFSFLGSDYQKNQTNQTDQMNQSSFDARTIGPIQVSSPVKPR